ncbi:MAG: hypothetical protein LJE85_00390 [Gammaproteobacteria bacterium]|nr:hypothetical protein [Gammaproteobacteria bacterium]
MDKKIILAILAFSALALVIGLLIPGGESGPSQNQPSQTLPWQIEPTSDGSIRVFGLTLGQSTLHDAEQQLRSAASVNLFAEPEQPPIVEAYFDKITAGGLSARMVLVIGVPPEPLRTMYERGARISTLGSGARKVTLTDEDLISVRNYPIASITYVPRTRLQPQWIHQRFGEPARRLTETGGETTHWLYPDKGLDVALDNKGHAILQYVVPAQFSRLQAPLADQSHPLP